MNNLKLFIGQKAGSDLESIADYIATKNKNAAVKLLKQFHKTFIKLTKFPNIGVKRKDFTHKDVKFYVMNKKYLIVYKSTEDSIHILRVLSTYQDICYRL